jgi:uncharacterized protein YkwD
MKKIKQYILIGTLGSSILLSGVAHAASSTPLWYQNYLSGKATQAGYYSTAPSEETPIQRPSESMEPTHSAPSTPTAPSTTPTQPALDQSLSGVSAEEQVLFNLLNQERVKRGLQPLRLNATLTNLARVKAKDMADNNYFSHTSPTYGKASNMVRNAGVSFWIVGENIAITSSAARANTLFMGSSVHRTTMLNKNYSEVGIGMFRKANGSLYVTEIFMATR